MTYYPSTKNPYDFYENSIIALLSATISGWVVGTFETLYFSKVFKKFSLSEKLIYKTSIYVVIIIGFLLFNTILGNSYTLNTGILDPRVWYNGMVFFSSFAFWSVVLYIAAIVLITLFYTEVSDNLGQIVLLNFLTGRYHHPKEEERIFMFVDMDSSTSIAEKLGHIRYFEMLNEYYADLSKSIIQFGGEVYQYVGDEITISWKMKSKTLNTNSVKCFFSMKKVIQQHSEKYLINYNFIPSFKCGLHCGKVTVGEIGVIKKDIIFSGDVLNVTSRILGLCKPLSTEILLSEKLMDKLDLEEQFTVKSMGQNSLRGRDEVIQLFSVDIA